jgi:hypothetical protein
MRKSKTRTDLEYMGLECLNYSISFEGKENKTLVLTFQTEEEAEKFENTLKRVRKLIHEQELEIARKSLMSKEELEEKSKQEFIQAMTKVQEQELGGV